MKTRATAAAIGIGPVTVAGVLLMACGLRWQAWVLLIATALMYFVWIFAGRIK
jgi:hypothetical protein